MALQGTLDTFALADVLRLLANTHKSGRLELDGDRGAGRVWLGDGQMVGGEAPDGSRADSVSEVVFHLLRFEAGDFVFHADDLPTQPTGPLDVEEVLIEAEQSLVEWREIELVVPSMDGWLTLEAELDSPDRTVKLSAADWQMVAAIGSGIRVVELAEGLEATDLAMCRAIKALVERDLVVVGDPVDAAELEAIEEAVEEVVELAEFIEDEALVEELAEMEQEVAAADEVFDASEISEPVGLDEEGDADAEYFVEDGVSHTARTRLDVLTAAYVDEPERTEASDALRNLMPEPLPGAGLTNGQLDDAEDAPMVAEAMPTPVAEEPAPAPMPEPPVEVAYAGFAEAPAEGEPEPQPLEADPELARQLSTLSPQAAAAIASAAGSINDPGRDPFPGRVRRSRTSSRTRN